VLIRPCVLAHCEELSWWRGVHLTVMRSSCSFSFDDSNWPLLLVRFEGEHNRQDFEAYHAAAADYLHRQQPHVVVIDMSRSGMLSAELRQRKVEWMQEHDPLIRRTVLGMAFIADTAFLRVTLSLVFYLKPPPCPYVILPREAQAVQWAVSRLESGGLHAAAARVRLRFGLAHEKRAS
jgi:hypothetical protein